MRSQGTSRALGSRALLLISAILPVAVTGCEDELLGYDDPDIITDPGSASGAVALRNGVIQRFTDATSGDESLWLFGGLLADEWRSGDTFEQRNSTDQRAIAESNSFLDDQLLDLNRVRTQGQQAIRGLRTYRPDPESDIGLMFALSGYMENLAGENYCNGIPFSGIADDGSVVYGGPVSVDSAFHLAIASADSALLYLTGDNGTVANLARVVRGRAQLNLGLFAEAAATVAQVPTGFEYLVFHSANTTTNQLWSLNIGQRRYVVANNEGGNGLNFVTANDPRLPVSGGGLAFDSNTPWFGQTAYGQFDASPAASGIEARMIEAEAALRSGDVQTWVDKLNAARATLAGLGNLADPGAEDAREDLMFRERAFWMFGTGHRLGDLRRLVRQYGRDAESVFPSGQFGKGGDYSTDTNIPISLDEYNNPNFDGCLNRNP